MGKFNKSGGREMPELNTSSLPDLVFAFLFFIMMVTTIREVTPKVSFSNLPNATELTTATSSRQRVRSRMSAAS